MATRSKDEMVDRAVGLLLVASKGAGAQPADLKRLEAEHDAKGKLSPEELTFYRKRKPSDREKIQFSWRFEAVRVLYWALGLATLPKPGEERASAKELAQVVHGRADAELRKDAKRRRVAELRELGEAMYQRHWELRDAQLNDRKPPRGYDSDTVVEWDHAIRWILNDCDEDWDEVSLDT